MYYRWHGSLVLALWAGSEWSRRRHALTDGPPRASKAETSVSAFRRSRGGLAQVGVAGRLRRRQPWIPLTGPTTCTTIGWKGLINDPGLDGSHDVHRGLRTARRLLLDIIGLGLPVGCEFLDPTSPQYIADTVTWGAIGARTTESPVHRQLASGLSMPVGFKNGTDGSVQAALDACRAARDAHVFFGVDHSGRACIVTTTGNPDCHVILRGGSGGPNYGPSHVAEALARLGKAGLPQALMIDASHGNSGKDHERQAVVAREIAAQIGAGQSGIAGVMIESFLVPGRQDLTAPGALTYGQSITDACMGWDTTAGVLADLAAAVRTRRVTPAGQGEAHSAHP